MLMKLDQYSLIFSLYFFYARFQKYPQFLYSCLASRPMPLHNIQLISLFLSMYIHYIYRTFIYTPDIYLLNYSDNISYFIMSKQASKSTSKSANLENPIQKDFSVAEMYQQLQRGLPTPFPFCDFYSITSYPSTQQAFITDLRNLYKESNTDASKFCLLMAFDVDYWNQISANQLPLPLINSKFTKYYKTNLKILLILKKRTKFSATTVKENISNFIKKWGLESVEGNVITNGMSQANDDISDTVIGGEFNDNIETPKDPYSLALQGLIGYQNSKHLGGSYLMAQKIDLKWTELLRQKQKHEQIIGRKKIEGDKADDSTIFSQNWCPHSHIKHSRVKDDYGNPIKMVRQSKPYFDNDPVPGVMSREKGIFFIGYLNDPKKIMKIVESQYASDHLLQFFNTILGNILYVPNISELGTAFIFSKSGQTLKNLSAYHGINWSTAFPGGEQSSKSAYLFYSRAQYLQKMSTADADKAEILEPPTPRTLRLMSKTFQLWQDTWYYDRRQPQMGHLKDYIPMVKKQKLFSCIKDYQPIKLIESNTYEKIPVALRQALGVYFELAHIITDKSYGYRGSDQKGQFGANTFHVEPEDILVGGQANLTFGQGKHLLDYLTEQQSRNNWFNGSTITEHSGVGHVVPHYDQIIQKGLNQRIKEYLKLFTQAKNNKEGEKVCNLYLGSMIALMGVQKYFKNYANLCKERAAQLAPSQAASIANLQSLANDLNHISEKAPVTFRQAAQLALSIFICLHVTGQPVSIGRLDQALQLCGKIPKSIDLITTEDQEVIDSFFMKVGEKVNLNTSFFEDHQKWGNLAMGGVSSAYPQGASFNQWGHQLTVGGRKRNGELGYNSVTMMCLKAARRLPINAPCLGLRVCSQIPERYLREATKAILSGGAHPILLNDDKIIDGIVKSGDYTISQSSWPYKNGIKIQQQASKQHQEKCKSKYTDQLCNYNSKVQIEDARNYSSDGCYEFLISGKCWFCLSGLPVLSPLQLLLNEGKELVTSGTRFIHGRRTHYQLYPLSELQAGTYEEFQDKYFDLFRKIVRKGFTFQLQAFGGVSSNWTTSLLNAFTEGLAQRKLDFYSNGTKYNQFCPQFTGIANLVNSLWNIRKYVFTNRSITLQDIRFMLLNNWGMDLTEPFVPEKLPNILVGEFKGKCKYWRNQILKSEEKFGLNKEVSDFGIRIAERIAIETVQIFSEPTQQTFKLLKKLSDNFTNDTAKFGLQIMPGCGTFENYQDNGFDLGASFDGRLKHESLAEDFSLQPYYADSEPENRTYKFKTILQNYKDPNFWSGSVLDFNIDQSFGEEELLECIKLFAQGAGPNVITITCCDRKNLQELQFNKSKDLIRLRMGGWTQFGVAMFPTLLNHHIRRIRSIP